MTETGLFGLIRLALRNARFVFGVGLATGIVSVAVGFVLPKWYVARTSLLPPHETRAVIDLGGLATALRGAGELPYSGGIEVVDVYLAILESESVGRTLITEHELVERFGVPNEEEALETLRSRTTIQLSDRGVLEILVEAKDPDLAADLANGHAVYLDRLYGQTRNTDAHRQRVFLEERVALSAAQIDSLQATLTVLQGEAGITAFGQDATEAAMAAGDLMGQKLALQVRLEMFRRLELDVPLRRELALELASLDSKIGELPVIGAELARQLRDIRIQERLHEALAGQLELARMEEVKHTPRVQVLDEARPPERHARPRKSLLAIAGTLVGGLLALAWVGYRER